MNWEREGVSAGRTGLGEVSGKKRESGEEQIFTLPSVLDVIDQSVLQ